MINSNNSTKRGGNNSTFSSQETPSLPQCLPLDPITLGNQKYNRSVELRRVLGVPIGSNLELYSEELKNFKESVQDTSKKARCRTKVLEQSISKLDEYRVSLGSVKRQRTDLLSNGRSSGGNASMENKTNNNKTTGLGPKTRIRTSMLDARTEGRATRQQQVVVVKKRENTVKGGSNDVEIEEKVQRLPTVGGNGGIGWEKKMKRKRSVGGTLGGGVNNNNINNNRAVNGSRDIKRATTLVKPTGDSELQSVDSQGFRSKASAVSSGIMVVESSIPINSSSRLTQRTELEKIPTLRDRTSIIDEMVVANGNIKSNIEMESPAGSPISVMKNKVSRTTRTSSSEHNKSAPALNFENNQKRPISNASSSCSSARHMAQWVGQRPLKISRTRRSNLAFPVSNANENEEAPPQISSPPSNLVAGTPSAISEGEECRGGEIKLKENGSDAGEVAVNADHKDRNFFLHPSKNKILVKREAGEKINNLPIPKPLQSSRRIPDKIRSKSGNHRLPKNRKAPVRAGSVLNCGSADFTGESDDREQLLAAAKYARNASNLACSSPFWKKMEYYFGSITSQDASYLKDKLNLAEELNGNLSQMLGDEYNALSVLMNKEKSNKKSVKNKAPSLYQRLLSALIEDDENEEPSLQSEVRNISFQSASDDSHCGSCNQTETELKERDNKVESEVESGADLHSHKHFLDRNSCSNTNGSLSNNEQWQADDGFSYSSSQIDAFSAVSSLDHQYEMLSIDDRLLMELQSIGLCPVIMPHLEEREELNQDIIDLQATLFQQVGKMKKHLGKIDKAIPDARDAERRNMEQVAMNQLVEMAYKRRMAYRANESSKTVIRRVSKQAGLAFARRTLDRCQKFEDTGKSCFAEPSIQDFLFSAPPSRNSNLLRSPSCVVRGRRKDMMMLDDIIINNGDDVNNKIISKQKANGNGARTRFVGTTHPTGPFNRGSGQTSGLTQEEPVGFENGFGSIELGGPQVDADLSSLLDFEEDGLQDEDIVGLEIPMDDLTDLQMLV